MTPAPVREFRDVTRARFEAEVLPVYAPAVLRGVARDWPVVAAGREDARGSLDHVARFDSGRPAEVFLGAPEIGGRFFYTDDLLGFNFVRQRVPLASVVGKLTEMAVAARAEQDTPAVYAGALLIREHAPGFAVENPMPLLDPGDANGRIWIGNAVTIATHYDLSRNIAVVAAGRRRFTLFPPDQLPNLYVGPLDRTMAGQPASLVDLSAPDLDRFPRFAEAMAHAQVAELEPGDAIYVPSMWWHQVQSFGPINVLVNYWWGQSPAASPFEALVHALVAMRDLPAEEREVWRGFLDHFVFDEGGARAPEHLPPAARGILGPPSPRRDTMIRNYLKAALNR